MTKTEIEKAIRTALAKSTPNDGVWHPIEIAKGWSVRKSTVVFRRFGEFARWDLKGPGGRSSSGMEMSGVKWLAGKFKDGTAADLWVARPLDEPLAVTTASGAYYHYECFYKLIKDETFRVAPENQVTVKHEYMGVSLCASCNRSK